MSQEEQKYQDWGMCPECGSEEYYDGPFVDTTSLHDGLVVEAFTCAKCHAFWLETYECTRNKKYQI